MAKPSLPGAPDTLDGDAEDLAKLIVASEQVRAWAVAQARAWLLHQWLASLPQEQQEDYGRSKPGDLAYRSAWQAAKAHQRLGEAVQGQWFWRKLKW